MSEISLKVKIEKKNKTQFRRVRVHSPSYESLCALVGGWVSGRRFWLQYIDEDFDVVELRSQAEWEECQAHLLGGAELSSPQNKTLNLIARVVSCGAASASPPQSDEEIEHKKKKAKEGSAVEGDKEKRKSKHGGKHKHAKKEESERREKKREENRKKRLAEGVAEYLEHSLGGTGLRKLHWGEAKPEDFGCEKWLKVLPWRVGEEVRLDVDMDALAAYLTETAVGMMDDAEKLEEARGQLHWLLRLAKHLPSWIGLAHYNLACIDGLLAANATEDEREPHCEAALQHLTLAASHGYNLQAMSTDEDLKALHTLDAFWALCNSTPLPQEVSEAQPECDLPDILAAPARQPQLTVEEWVEGEERQAKGKKGRRNGEGKQEKKKKKKKGEECGRASRRRVLQVESFSICDFQPEHPSRPKEAFACPATPLAVESLRSPSPPPSPAESFVRFSSLNPSSPSPSGESPVRTPVPSSPSSSPPPTPRPDELESAAYTAQLELLHSMGLVCDENTLALLRQYDGDLPRVIANLLD